MTVQNCLVNHKLDEVTLRISSNVKLLYGNGGGILEVTLFI